MVPDDSSSEVYVQLFSAEASQQNTNIAKALPERATLRKVKKPRQKYPSIQAYLVTYLVLAMSSQLEAGNMLLSRNMSSHYLSEEWCDESLPV